MVQHYVCTGKANWEFVGRKLASMDALELRSSADDEDPQITSCAPLSWTQEIVHLPQAAE